MSEYSVSVKSSRVSSILKTPSIKSRLSSSKTPNKVRFQLNISRKLRRILQQYIDQENVREYENLVISIRDAELLDSDIKGLLTEATQCISLLNRDLRLFVEAVLSVKWTHRSADVISEYRSFLLNLLSAHNYHAKYAIDRLVFNLLPDNDEEWPGGIPSDEDCQKCVNVHSIFNILLKVIPMCQELLLNCLRQNFPYYKKTSHMHEYYIHNLLWMLDYQPHLRLDILNLIISRLVVLDVNAPKEEIEKMERNGIDTDSVFKMDVDQSIDEKNRILHPIGYNLDVSMDKLFNYIIMECHDTDTGTVDWDKTKRLYQDLISVFDKIILPTYNLHHVQFVIFLLCSFKTAIAEAFLNYLWKKVCTPSTASVIRQTAVSYIASFIARASIVPLSMIKGTLQQMAEWIHSYISAQDELECINNDVRIHTVFYSVCQAVFYVIAFRQGDLVRTRKNITFLDSLNLGKIVTCRLNPLRVCQPAVVQNFAAVTRTYQLAYCYSVIEHNSRSIIPTIYRTEEGSTMTTDNMLDSFFPFDPYILYRSGEKITPFYINYTNSFDENNSSTKHDFEDDDFLCDQDVKSNDLSRFSYGTSPGFRTKENG